MLALTLTRPWAYAIMWCGKEVENRTWAPPKSVIGQRIAIHSGKGYDKADAALIAAASCTPMHLLAEERQPTGIVCTAVLAEVVTEKDRPRDRFNFWWSGPVGFVLEDVVRLPKPIPCRGAQKFWKVPDELLERLS